MSCALEPEDLWAVFNSYRETVRRAVFAFGGIICHHKGDGILCCFGYPLSHEDNASRAVMAALDIIGNIQRSSDGLRSGKHNGRELRLRIGVATGEVAVVDRRADDPDGLELLGPAPSLAARLQNEAGQNMVLVDDTTFRLTHTDFRYGRARKARIKGFRKALTVHRPVMPTHGPTRFDRTREDTLSEFVNRNDEQAVLLEAWEKTCAGRGQVVCLIGEPGIGKSRLTRNFLKRLANGEGLHSIKLQCSALFTRTPLHPFAASLSHFIALEEEETEEAKVLRLRAFLTDLGIRDGFYVPLLARLVDLPAAQYLPLLSTLSPEEIRTRTTDLLVSCLEDLARQHPLILVAEDLHWADATSLALIEDLAARTADKPVMIIATYRPSPQTEQETPLSGLKTARNCRSLTLERLNQTHSAVIVSSVVRLTGAKALPSDWIARIVERSDGVPLFIEELTRAVLEKNDGHDIAAPLPASRMPADGIPATLRDSLTARLDDFYPGEPDSLSPKRIAQIGACLGRDFTLEMLVRVAAATGLPPTVGKGENELRGLVDKATDQLVAADLVYRTAGRMPTYRFKHALVQDAAYAGLWREDKIYIHARILELLEENWEAGPAQARPELLAHHAREAGRPEAAAGYWLTAAKRAAARSNLKKTRAASEEALRLAREAPAGPDRVRTEMKALVALGTVLMVEDGFTEPEVERHFNKALKLVGQIAPDHLNAVNGSLLSAQLGKQIIMLVRGQHRQALRLARKCLATARQKSNPYYEIEARRQMGASLFWSGRPAESRQHLSVIPDLYNNPQQAYRSVLFGKDSRPGVLAFLAMSQAMLGMSETALETSHLSLRMAMELNHGHTLGYTLLCRAILHDLLGRPDSAEAAQMALEYCGNRSLPFWGRWAQITLGHAMIRSGEVDDGLQLAETGFAALIGMGARVAYPYLLAMLAQGDLRAGAFEKARKRLESATLQASQSHEGFYQSELWRQCAVLDAQTAPPEQTECLFVRALKHTRRRNMLLFEARTALDFANWLASQNRHGESGRIVRKSLTRCRKGEDRDGIAALEAFLKKSAPNAMAEIDAKPAQGFSA